jgi:hypothetical protein
MKRRCLTEDEVEFELRCEPEDIPFVGNCSAIDDETDRQAEEWILEQLESGNQWAWCCVVVTARWEGFEGRASLGGCSYRSEKDFRCPGGYFDDLRVEALDDLNARIAQTIAVLNRLVT